MKLSKIFTFAAILIMMSLIRSNSSFAQEKKIDLNKVPKAVLASFHKAYPNAEIKGTSTEKEKGHKYYEIESMEGSKHIDLLISKSGKIEEVEETIPASELPSPVMKTLNAKFQGLKINRAEKVTSGKKITFELSIESNNKKHGVVILPDGKIIKSKNLNKENEKEEKGEKGKKEENDND